MQSESGEEELHVVIETSTPIDAERVRAALNRVLKADAQARIRYVPSLPRNPMGKVVRHDVRARIAAGR